ncbi:hypothetical protein Tco_1475526 [Tanacetum coccineum]
MNLEEIRQVTAHDEKWVPTKERVKIGTSNVRLETTVPQKEETFQVIIDVIKNSTYYKAFTISAEVPEIFMQQFWHTVKKILDICPRVQGEDIIEVLYDESTLTFLINLGYKGPLYKHPSMYVDHMHPPWRTLDAIINKRISSKTASNDRLRKSRIEILWGMFYKENVDYSELIWEDFAFQIDHMMENQRRRENMPYPRFTKIIINHFLSQNKSIANLKHLHTHTIKDDGVVSRLKFFRIGEDFQEYGLPIPETMMIEKIKQSESYQMFIKYSTVLIPPKKSRGKGSQGNKAVVSPKPASDEESDESNAKPAKNEQAVEDLTEAAEEEATRQVHATHERIVTESDPEPTRRRPSASKKSIRSQPHAGGSSEGTGTKPGVPDESTITFTTSSEGTDQKSKYSKEDQGDDENIPWESTDEDEKKKDDDDDKCIDLKKSGDEETDDELVHSKKYVQDNDEETDDELVPGDEQVNEDEDEEMTNAKDADTGNSDEEIIDAEKAEEVKDEIKKAELPPSGFILSVSSGFGNQFLNLSSDTSLIVSIHTYCTYFVISVPSLLNPIPETPLVAPATTLLHPSTVSSISHKDVQELKEVDNTTTLRALLRPEILPAVNEYLGSSLGDALQKSMQANVINEVKNQLPKFLPKAVSDFTTPVIQSTVKKTLEKTPLLLDDAIASGQADPEKIMRKKDRDDEDPSAGPNQGKKTKRSRTKESEPSQKSSTSKESSKGKSPAKTSKSGKSVTVEEPVEELVFEMASDDIEQTIDDVANDVNQPPDDLTQTKDKDPKKDWFKQL